MRTSEIEIKSGKYKRGQPYPQYAFYLAKEYGITHEVLACSNDQLKIQIDKALQDSPDREEITYFYFYIKEVDL